MLQINLILLYFTLTNWYLRVTVLIIIILLILIGGTLNWTGWLMYFSMNRTNSIVWLTVAVTVGFIRVIDSNFNTKNLLKLICISIIGFLGVTNLIIIYIMYEIVLIPIVLIIIFWGSQPERISASNYLLIYGILPAYVLLRLICWDQSESINLIILKNEYQWLRIFISVSILVKAPLYGFHAWLPRAHVEAPILGSVLLAGLLLKIGTIGYLRLLPIRSDVTNQLLSLIIILGTSLCGFIRFCQSDLKSYIAFRSIIHINFLLWAIERWYTNSLEARWVIGWVHGFVSSLMFVIRGLLIHTSFTRLTIVNSFQIISRRYLCWITLLIANYNVPPSIGFNAELLRSIALVLKTFFLHNSYYSIRYYKMFYMYSTLATFYFKKIFYFYKY